MLFSDRYPSGRSESFEESINRSVFFVYEWKIKYEKNTGLKSMSLPLKFKNQAISSREVISKLSASIPNFSATLSYFSYVVIPEYFGSR
jgi:hypothetical protein